MHEYVLTQVLTKQVPLYAIPLGAPPACFPMKYVGAIPHVSTVIV